MMTLLAVARIVKPLGLRGDLIVYPITQEPKVRFASGKKLLLAEHNDPQSLAMGQTVTISRSHVKGKHWIIRFENIGDRTEAEEQKGRYLFVHADDLEPLSDNELYDYQLLGLRVEDGEGKLLGSIESVQHLPAHDVLVINAASSDKKYYIPFTYTVVPDIDVTRGFLTVYPPEGLLDV